MTGVLSNPPRGVRVCAPVAHLFRVPLPRYSETEIARLRALLRRKPIPNSKFPGGRACNPPLAPAPAFPPGLLCRITSRG